MTVLEQMGKLTIVASRDASAAPKFGRKPVRHYHYRCRFAGWVLGSHASLACYNKKPTVLQHFATSYTTFACAGGAEQKAEFIRASKHHQRRTTRRLMMARMTTVSRKVKTVEAEMTAESAVFSATHMLACALDAQCFAMPSPSPFNPHLSCCICTIRAVVTFSLHLPCRFCSWTMASCRYLCMARSLYGVHAVLFTVGSIIQLTSNCCFSKVLIKL